MYNHVCVLCIVGVIKKKVVPLCPNLQMDSPEKREQELQSLRRIDDSFRKIVVLGDDIAPYTDENGITYMGLFHFLLHQDVW